MVGLVHPRSSSVWSVIPTVRGGCNLIPSLLFLSSIYLVSVSMTIMSYYWHHHHHQTAALSTTSSSAISMSMKTMDINNSKNNTSEATNGSSDTKGEKNHLRRQDKLNRGRTLPGTEPKITSYLSPGEIEYLKSQLLNKSIVYSPGPYDGAGIVVEEYKLVFFTQGKVACTVFKQLLRRMMKLHDWNIHKEPHIPHNPLKNSLTYLYHYNVDDALTILTSPQWTRAIFVRDPKERTLSAFLDKAARKNGLYIRRHCCPQGARNHDKNKNALACYEKANGSFLGFLQVIQESCCCDPHWRKQSDRITPAFRPYINFVGHFENVQSDTKRLLDEVDKRLLPTTTSRAESLWEMYGADGWGPSRNETIFSDGTKAKHETSAITKMKQFYNVTTERLVDEMFHDDYHDEILNFKPVRIM